LSPSTPPSYSLSLHDALPISLLLLVGSGPECFRIRLGDLLLNQLSLAGLHREVGLRRCDLGLTRVAVHGNQVAGVPGKPVVSAGTPHPFFPEAGKMLVGVVSRVVCRRSRAGQCIVKPLPLVVPLQRDERSSWPDLSPVVHLPDAVERATLRRARRSFHHLRHVSSLVLSSPICHTHTGHDVLTEHRSQRSPGFASQFSDLMPSFTEWKTSTTSCRLTVVRS